MSAESLTIKAGVNGAGVMEGLGKLEERLAQFHERIIAAFAVTGLTVEFGESLSRAFEQGGKQEELIEGMAVLAGGTEKAKDRLAEMSDLIQKSPFGKQQFAEAWKSLQLYTNGLYANNQALKLVGDVSAATQEPIEDISRVVGLAYSSIAEGEGGGRALRMLVRLGAVSDDTAQKISRMGMGKANAGAVWQVLQAELMKFDGTMEAKSHSWAALMKNFQESVDKIYAQFAEPIMDALKPMLEQASIISSRVATYAQAAGEAVAKVIKVVVQAFREGEVISLISDALVVGFKVAVNYLAGALYASANGFGQAILAVFNTDFADGIGNIFIGLAEQFGAALMRAFAGPINALISAANYVPAKLQARSDEDADAKLVAQAEGSMKKYQAQMAAADKSGDIKAYNAAADKYNNMSDMRDKLDSQFQQDRTDAKIGISDYIKEHANDSISFGGLSADDWDTKGRKDVHNGAEEMKPILGTALDNFIAAVRATVPADLFGGLNKQAEALKERFAKLLEHAQSLTPKEKTLKNPFAEHLSIPTQMTKGVADSFAEIGAGGRVSSYQHFDPMVEQQRLSNEYLAKIAGNSGEDSDAVPLPDWSSLQ